MRADKCCRQALGAGAPSLVCHALPSVSRYSFARLRASPRSLSRWCLILFTALALALLRPGALPNSLSRAFWIFFSIFCSRLSILLESLAPLS